MLERTDDRVWKALSHPLRRRMLDVLAREPRTTGDMCARFESRELGRTGVLRHLRLLEEASLVIKRQSGRECILHFNPATIQRVCDRWVSRLVRPVVRSMLALKSTVERDSALTGEPAAQHRQHQGVSS